MGKPRLMPDPSPILMPGGRLKSYAPGLPYLSRVVALGPIAYWPLNEVAGTSGANSVIDYSGNSRHATPTSVTFGATGIGDGNTAADFNTASIAIPAGALGALNGVEGSLSLWFRVRAAGQWSDAERYVLNIASLTSSQIIIETFSSAVYWTHLIGGTTRTYNQAETRTTWLQIGLTWSATGSAVIAYLNGSNVQTLGAPGASFGTINIGKLGATTSSTNPMNGYLAHVGLWDRPLSAAEMLKLATV